MIKRWGKPWYYIGIAGNVGFIILYVITRFPGNPVVGRGGDVAAIDMVCELSQVAYIVITAVILAKGRTKKVTEREQLNRLYGFIDTLNQMWLKYHVKKNGW